MHIITRTLEFDAGHRIIGHQGKCRHLHGHRYKAEIGVSTADIDDLGMVVDFGIIKDLIGAWIDDSWDHNMILNRKDPLMIIDGVKSRYPANELFGGRDPYLMPYDSPNPTAENMAEVLHGVCIDLLPDYLMVVYVRIWETPNCSATYFGDEIGQFINSSVVRDDHKVKTYNEKEKT